MRKIPDVLNEMVGANYLVTRKQINEILAIDARNIEKMKELVNKAYDAGRKHDPLALRAIKKTIDDLS